MQKQYFVRKDKMTILHKDGDITIPAMKEKILLKGQNVYIQDGEGLTEQKIENGDSMKLGNIKITFFQDCIEVEGEHTDYHCVLEPLHYREIPFDGFPYYKKSPRIIYQIPVEKIEIKSLPGKEKISKGTLAQVIIPPLTMMVITACMSILMKRGIYVIASVCMTSVTLIFSMQRFFRERKEMHQRNEKRIQVYEDYLVGIRSYIKKKQQKEKEAYAYQMPEIKQLEQAVREYSSRLYERSPEDEDFLWISLGYHKDVSHVRVSFQEDELQLEKDELQEKAKQVVKDFKQIASIPLFIDLHHGHLGIVGEEKNIRNQLKYILMQTCFFHSYHDVQIVFIGNEKSKDEFSYLRWYPHLRIQAINIVANIFTNSVRDQVLGSILQVIKDRKQKLEESNKEAAFLPHFLFVIEDACLIQDHAIMEYLGKEAECLGISIIYTTNQIMKLPENVKTVCVLDDSKQGHLALYNGKKIDKAFEIVSMEKVDVELVSRKTAAIIHEKGMISRIPDSITFFDMYKIKTPEELNAQIRWKNHEAHKSLAVPLGVREQDNYVELNLHEKAHGPHGLVAGTTGSGKSEIVQSYILSLAANFHPYEVGFLLIDYKGGGMANLFQNLPHLLGTITNLDGTESYRAMVSIKSELARRQKIFNEYGVNHINGYHKLFKLGKVAEPIPHLFLISDEFAELKKEQPEFMKELVSTARIGRSLGIHLILATQKPTGVVDDQIWTNSKFKLCLKVQNESDSREMLKTSDAALITQPGRAYLQVGNNEIYELFQSAFSGAAYDADDVQAENTDKRVYLINDIGQGQLLNQDLGGTLESNQIRKTQLDVVVDYLAGEFQKTNLPRVKSPWLPSLKNIMTAPDYDDIKDSGQQHMLDLKVAVGVEDIPSEQRQSPYILDFLNQGHVIYFASTGYGKTVFLETLLLGLCRKNSVANFNAYIMDFGNNALLPLKALPHVADYMTYEDTEKQQKLLQFLLSEMKKRKKLMAQLMAQNFDIYNQSADRKLKAILVIIDNYDIVKEIGLDEGFFVQLARDGANLGIYLAITASRGSVVKFALMNQIKTKIAGFNYEPMEVRNIVGRSEYELPEVKGRTMVKNESVNMMQVYSPVPYESGLEFNKNLLSLIQRICEASTEQKAKGIAVLPEHFPVQMLEQFEKSENAYIGLGLEKQSITRYGICVMDTPFLIIGPSHSGKTNAVRIILAQSRQFARLFLFDSRDYELLEYEDREEIVYVDDKEKLQECMEELQDIIEERKIKRQMNRGKRTLKELYEELDTIGVLINGLEDFVSFVEDSKETIQVLQEAAEVGIAIILCGHSAHIPVRNETAKLIKSAECGLVLGEMGVNTPFTSLRARDLPGCLEDGVLYRKGESVLLRLPKA